METPGDPVETPRRPLMPASTSLVKSRGHPVETPGKHITLSHKRRSLTPQGTRQPPPSPAPLTHTHQKNRRRPTMAYKRPCHHPVFPFNNIKGGCSFAFSDHFCACAHSLSPDACLRGCHYCHKKYKVFCAFSVMALGCWCVTFFFIKRVETLGDPWRPCGDPPETPLN